jgi:hypothetical protein
MKKASGVCAAFLASVIAGAPATAKVFFRVTPFPLPPAQKTGIEDLVLLWPLPDSSSISRLRSEGYRVWLQCESKDLGDAVTAADQALSAGVIVFNSQNSRQSLEEQISTLAIAHKNLAFRNLVSGGKQPQMKGRLVVERDGVLQVSSPSTQPWLDTNLAMVRLAQSAYPDSFPIAYDFPWSTEQGPAGAWHPDAEDYALAIAESDAIRSDVIIDLPIALQKALNADEPQAWSLWTKAMAYLDFASRAPAERSQPVANLGVIVDDARDSYEAVNLMARHNLAFAAIRPGDLTRSQFNGWNAVVVFCALNHEAVAILQNFAQKGGIVVFVNSRGNFPWHSAPPLRREPHSTTYTIGSGQIVELGEPVIDPENFARDLRRLIGRERSVLGLWNSLTTLVTAYRVPARREITLYLVNYADQPDNVQVQVQGRFRQVRFESPDEPCCVSLSSVERNGFTEFTIPSLRIAARVHLDSRSESSATQ